MACRISSSDQPGPPGTISAQTSSGTASLGSRRLQLGLGSGLIHLKSSTWLQRSSWSGRSWWKAWKSNWASRRRQRKRSNTYICFRYPAKPDVWAIFNDGITRAAEVDIDIFAVVHAELLAGYDDDAVLHASDVCRASSLTANQKAFLDALDS
jgi:hypothetical protein